MFGWAIPESMLLKWMVCQNRNGKKYYLSEETEKPTKIVWSRKKDNAMKYINEDAASTALDRISHDINSREKHIYVEHG